MRHNISGVWLVGACLLLASCIRLTMSFTRKTNPKIIVIGAGASGISSAVRLLQYGFDVIILEAEPRIGGRIHTIPFGKNVIDMGAQWCHGEVGNIIYDLAYKEELLEHSPDGEYSYVRSNAELLTHDVVERLEELQTQLKAYRAMEVMEYHGSMGSFMRRKFNKLLEKPENADLDKKIAHEFYEMFEKEQSSDEGTDTLDVISSRDFMQFEEIDGDYELHWKDKGFRVFLNLLMKSNITGTEYGILDGRIKLNKKVVHINWQRDDNDQKTLVKCEDGEEFLADHVIVTVSLGVLKANYEHMFEPPLPQDKANAIKAMGYGSFAKVFLEFPEPFWAKSWEGIWLLWRLEDLAEIRGTNRSWLEGLYGLNTLPYQPNILEGWVVGEAARHMETLPLDEIKDGCMFILKKFLPPNVPEPVNVTISTWYSNPNFHGCYSYHSLETEKANVKNEDLAKTIMNCDADDNHVGTCEKPVLQFAGEATESKHYATVHGAVLSGFREAERIHDYYTYRLDDIQEEGNKLTI